MAIQEGKIDGDGFTFSTVQHTKKGDVKFTWQGTLEGEQISGRCTRDRAKRGVLCRPIFVRRAPEDAGFSIRNATIASVQTIRRNWFP